MLRSRTNNNIVRMIAEEPKCADTGKYSTKETCAILQIHRSTLERYRAANMIRAGYRTVNNRKFYTGFEIKKLWRRL